MFSCNALFGFVHERIVKPRAFSFCCYYSLSPVACGPWVLEAANVYTMFLKPDAVLDIHWKRETQSLLAKRAMLARLPSHIL